MALSALGTTETKWSTQISQGLMLAENVFIFERRGGEEREKDNKTDTGILVENLPHYDPAAHSSYAPLYAYVFACLIPSFSTTLGAP